MLNKRIGQPVMTQGFSFVSKQFVSIVSLLCRNREFRCFEKQTEDPYKQFERDLENLGLFRFVSVCYETVLFVSVVSI